MKPVLKAPRTSNGPNGQARARNLHLPPAVNYARARPKPSQNPHRRPAPPEPPQRVVKVRRDYNSWVASETMEDYALRYTPQRFRKWSDRAWPTPPSARRPS
jgi:hypothetical protein